MSTYQIDNVVALANIKDLTVPTSTQGPYQLGKEISIFDTASKAVKKYKYMKAHGALTAYVPYVVSASSTAGSEVITAAPATLGAPGSLVVVPQIDVTSGYYFFGLIEGDGKVIMTAETYAVGDTLQVLNTGVAVAVDGSTGSPAITVNTCAICKEAGSTAAARNMYLIGRLAVIAAS